MVKVSVGILTFNRRDDVIRAIESVYKQTYNDIEIVVVDSASSDGTSEAIESQYPEIKLIKIPRNLGCPGGRNHVFANCCGQFIVNLDDDGMLDEDAIKCAVEILEANSDVGIVSMELLDPGIASMPAGVSECVEVSEFSGGASVFRSSMLKEIGGYPDCYFLLAEEMDLAIRALDKGYRILHTKRAIMWHKTVRTTGETKWDYYRYRNPCLVVIRLFPPLLLVKYLMLRFGSYFFVSIRRKSFDKYLMACLYVVCHGPLIIKNRKACNASSVDKFFRLRDQRKKYS